MSVRALPCEPHARGGPSEPPSLGGSGRRYTIGLLFDYINFVSGGYQTQLRNAYVARAAELGLNLLFFFGRALDEPNPQSRSHNEIFQLANPGLLDGLVVLSTCLSRFCGAEGVARFLATRPSMPLCSVGVEIPGIPSVLVDNRAGMAALVDHVIRDHGRQHIAFIGGDQANPESQVRLAAYKQEVERHQLRVDPRLLVNGDFSKQGGEAAAEQLLSQGLPVDAMIAANDNMALGAIETLRKRGIRVPEDVVVTGFDDAELARLGNPPLSTVRQPFEQLTHTTFQALLDQIAGKSVHLVTTLQPHLVIRKSCGCESHSDPSLSIPSEEPDSAAAYLHVHGTRVARELTNILGLEFAHGERAAATLLSSLESELLGEQGSFTRALQCSLQMNCGDYNRHRALHNAVTYLRGELAQYPAVLTNELWFRSLSAINLASTNAQVVHRMRLDDNYLRLIVAGEQASAAMDLTTLTSILERTLPSLGIQTALLTRYSSGADTLDPFLFLIDGRAQPVEPTPLQKIVPTDLAHNRNAETWLVFPLAYEAQLLGVAVFKYDSESKGYHLIRDQISAALRSLQLHQEIVEKTTLHERSVQERLATANRIQALSVLAGGVAHDLNNVLGPLVALPEIILDELTSWHLPDETVADVIADVESIRAAALRAAQTIKDLLTLGRQGQVEKAPVDLNRLLTSCLSDGSLRFIQEQRNRVKVTLTLTPESTTILGSEAHLVRAISNLVKNAVEAIPGLGEVVVRTSVVELAQPLSGYETIESGDYVVVSVSDNGSGIAKAEVARLFEPFFSRKHQSDHSGSGLGLAIVHGVVKEHAGFVDVHSEQQSGTTFCLYLPRLHERARSVRPEPRAQANRAKVLVVDDSPIQLRTARRILVHLGYEVETLESGREAANLFREAAAQGASPYDLVILDMMLNEEHDGLAVLENIRQWFPNQRAILATGNAPPGRAELASRQGVIWLAKPYTIDEIAHAVNEVLQESIAPKTADSVPSRPSLASSRPLRLVRHSQGPVRG